MTTRTAPKNTRFPRRLVGGAVAAGLGLAVALAFARPWSTTDAPERRVINPAPAFAEHEQYIAPFLAATDLGSSVAEQAEVALAQRNAVFPLPPSDGGLSGPMSLAEAVAQHGALIDAWLSRAG